MELLHSIRSDYSGTSAIFEIKINDTNNVYMRADRTSCLNDERFVTIVNAKKFLNLWSLEPNNFNSELSKGKISSWRNDRKFHSATRGFSQGFNNPVPLAKVVCKEHFEQQNIYKKRLLRRSKIVGVKDIKFNYIDFINGITRTIWLLSQEVEYFPVECGVNDGIESLAKECGINDEYISINKLTSRT